MDAMDKAIIETLREQLETSMKVVLKYKNPGKKKSESRRPFFISFTIKEASDFEIEASCGSVISITTHVQPRKVFWGELRVGDYRSGCSKSIMHLRYPHDNDFFTLKRDIWIKINEAIYEAVKNLNGDINESIDTPDEFQPFTYFSQEKPVQHTDPRPIKIPDMEFWSREMKEASKILVADDILFSSVYFSHHYEKRYFINSEGTVIVDSYGRSGVSVSAGLLSPKEGVIYKDHMTFWNTNPDKLPRGHELREKMENFKKELYEIRDAPYEEAGTYPVIVDGENHGVIWHEAIGHSLEGNRQEEDDDEGDGWCDDDYSGISLTFKDKINKPVAPKFFTVCDDPTIPGMDGSYGYDDEGVPAQRVVLVENGILKNYLHSRESAGKHGHNSKTEVASNGHARADNISTFPKPRMSNIIVKSSHHHSLDDLKKMLIAECKKRGKKYGLILMGTIGGFTATEFSFFHTFPKKIVRLYVDGREELVKGLYLVSTPYQLLENIVATTDKYEVFNGNCGSESGWVPSTQTAPEAFIRSVEFGRIPRSSYVKYPPLLSPPPR